METGRKLGAFLQEPGISRAVREAGRTRPVPGPTCGQAHRGQRAPRRCPRATELITGAFWREVAFDWSLGCILRARRGNRTGRGSAGPGSGERELVPRWGTMNRYTVLPKGKVAR